MQYKNLLFVCFLILFTSASAFQDENDQEDNSYIDVHQHPRNGFSCEGKKIGEYYSDVSTNCQLYYVCLPNAQLKLAPTSFACPNTTRFNQATRVCSPADQVYCNIAERYYENVHGSIDSKGNKPNEYLGADFDKTPWQINKKTTSAKSLIVPLNLEPEFRSRPQPRTLPKVEANVIPKNDAPSHSTFALTFNQPQAPRVVARTRASTTATSTSNARRGNTIELSANSLNQPSTSNRYRPSTIVNQNSRSRLPIYSNQAPGRNSIVNVQPSTIATTPSTTTTTTSTTTIAPLVGDSISAVKPNDSKSTDYVYDYVEYDAPAANQPANTASNNALKPPAIPAIPALDEAQPPNRIANTNSNIGSLFSNVAINNQQQPPRISQPSSFNRPPQRSLPQTSSLNYFNSNPFASNPFSSNPFANSNTNSPSLIRQKRDAMSMENSSSINGKSSNDEEIAFSCYDKLPGIAYADVLSNCSMYHICIPMSKGKYKDYQLFCENGQAFNQWTANCEPVNTFDCKRSKIFYLYNKKVNTDSYMKNRFRIAKKLADIKN